MNIFQSIILGIIQGITEWLPVSSSGHLVIAQEFFGLQNALLFDILLHIATLSVIFIILRKEIFNIAKACFKLDFKSENGKLALFIVVASVPTGIIGILFKDLFEKVFSNLFGVAIGLMITGIVLLLTKKIRNKFQNLNFKNSIMIGIAQGIAITPGISRSGSTIATGIMLGIDKDKVAKFSFLLSIPAILGASLLESKKLLNPELSFDWVPKIAGMVTAAIIGYITLKALLKIIQSDKFYLFGYYCIGLSITLFGVLIFK